ncbi:putative LPS assembly protein LptD [Chitinophagaceae bacterium MMS25-I14]
MAVIFIFNITNPVRGQSVRVPGKDSSAASRDTTVLPTDSLKLYNDTLKKNDTLASDSTAKSQLEDSLGIRISSDALSSVVTAEASDSAIMDMHRNLFYLYGNAKVNWEDLKLNAGVITYDQNSNLVTAAPSADSVGVLSARPTFTQGSELVTYDSLQYNFKSKRAIIRNARSKYGEGYVFSQQVKRNPDQSIYGWHNIYTTCSLDTPHYGIWARKIKVIPGKVIAAASAHIVIENVPTPLFLPFGLFPISEQQRSGFRLPSYTVEQARGLGITNGGYYFYLNDYADLLVQGTVFTKGSWSGTALTTYNSRYQYNGSLLISYAYNKTGETYEPGSSITKDFMVQWQHRTDSKAKPGESFTASVTAGTSSFYSNNSYNVNQILNNQYQSNITYSKTWANKPYSLTVSARHNQNTQSHVVNVSLPEINFYISQFNPFHNKNATGTHWYDKITAGYTVNASNQITFYDSTFSLKTLALNDFHNGIHHSIPVSAAYTIFRFVNMSFNVSYNEYWLTQQRYEYFDNLLWKLDTISNRGFYTARDLDASMQLSTRIYGLVKFKHSNLMGIRHVLTPSIGFNYRPDYGRAPFNYYYQTYLSPNSAPVYLSPYDGSVVGTPGLGQYGTYSSSVQYGLNNNLQIKVRNSKDSSTGNKNITLIDALSFSGSYNVAADSFKWSPVAVSFRTNILNKLSLSGAASFDPYDYDYEHGRRSTHTMWDDGKGIARFTNANLALSANFRSKNNSKDKPKSDDANRMLQNGGYNDYVDFNIPWSLNVAYSLALNKSYSAFSKRDTLVVTQNTLFSGDLNITSRWKFTFSSGYDFTNHQVSFTQFDIYRDLHCWEMRLSTIPFGIRKSFTFTLNVKASVLQDLKLLRRRDYRDAVY